MNHMMDHRLAQRWPVDVEVTVEAGHQHFTKGRIRDASIMGVFIEMAVAGMHVDAPVRLAFRLPGERQSTARHWHGYVVRRDREGIGAMFDSEDAGDLEGLRALIAYAMHRTSG